LLYDRFYQKGLIIDCIKNLELKVLSNVNAWKGDLKILEESVNPENIEKLITNNCHFEIDLFSIDIDGVDYWVINKIKRNISKIFIAEYNPVFGSKLEVTVPNISGFDRNKYHYSNLCYGMSLKALINLMIQKGYYFVGTNLQKNNAFFILKEFSKEVFFQKIKIKNLDNYINSNIRESRDKKNHLTYLSGDKKFKEIQECEVINLKDDKKELIKLKKLV
jgi:hypothetical protein